MKKIALLVSMVSLLTLAACGSTPSQEENVSNEAEVEVITSSEDTELSEEEVDALFEEMMNQVDEEMSSEMDADFQAGDMPYVEDNGELNPGMTE